MTLFPDLAGVGASVNVNLAGPQQYRYKVFDTTIPLRNMLLANN